MAPEVGETARAFVVDRKSAREFVWFSAALAAALDAAVTADGHDAAFLAPEHASAQRKIHDRFHVVHAEFMLRETHAVDENSRAGTPVKQRKALHLKARDPRALLEHLPRLGSQSGFELFEAAGVIGDELLIYPAQGNERLENAIDKRDIATHAHLKEVVH